MSAKGQVDLFVQLSYVLFLGLIGVLMLQESTAVAAARAAPGGAPSGAP